MTDVQGNVTHCDPAFGVRHALTLRGGSVHRYSHLLQTVNTVTVRGGTPGIQALDLFVNGRIFHVANVKSSRTTKIDIGAAMRPGTKNLVVARVHGKHAGTVKIVISD